MVAVLSHALVTFNRCTVFDAYVYDVLNDEFNTEEIVRGMMYWYFVKGRTINNLHDDMLYHSHGFYKADDIKEVLLVVKRACEDFIA